MPVISDDFAEKIMMPTPRRLEEARRRGIVARSGDLVVAAAVLASAGAFVLFGPALVKRSVDFTAAMISFSPAENKVTADGTTGAIAGLFLAAVPLILAMAAVAIVANLLQVGFIASAEPFRPDIGRLSPLAGMKRLFAGRSFARMAFNAVKLCIVAAIAYYSIIAALPEIVSAAGVSFGELAGRCGLLAVGMTAGIGAALLALAITDWLFQRWQLSRDLRMTRREWLDDVRQSELSAVAKGRIRGAARRLLAGGSAADVRRAAVVITAFNGPVAAISGPDGADSPRVLAKGGGAYGGRIVRWAVQYGVPVLEDAPLARTIYLSRGVGEELPESLHEQAAEAIAYAENASAMVARAETITEGMRQ